MSLLLSLSDLLIFPFLFPCPSPWVRPIEHTAFIGVMNVRGGTGGRVQEEEEAALADEEEEAAASGSGKRRKDKKSK